MEHEQHSHHETQTHHESAHSKKRFALTTPLAIVAGAAIIALGLIGYGLTSRTGSNSNLTFLEEFQGADPSKAEFVEGSKNASVFIVEYSDPECPFCARFHPTMNEIRKMYEGKVAFVYNNFPLTQIHPNAFSQSVGIYCAGKVAGSKAYFDYMTKLFDFVVANNYTPQFPEGKLVSFAKELGINETAWNECLIDPASGQKIQDEMQDGQMAGVSGTPSTFILVKDSDDIWRVAKVLEGASQVNYVKTFVDRALQMTK